MTDKLVLGTRGSALAMAQTEAVAKQLRIVWPFLQVEVEVIETSGDRDQDGVLAEIGGVGVFTKEIEDALLEGRIDAGVHSLKDLPVQQPEGLVIASVPEREAPFDGFISYRHTRLEELAPDAVVGTSSVRRKAFLLNWRPDLRVEPLRGNIDTRLRKIREGEVAGAILACAGLRRLGHTDLIQQSAPVSVMPPAPGQGAIAIEVRSGDAFARERVEAIHRTESGDCAAAERSCLAALGGGCQTPLGAMARVQGEEMTLTAAVAARDGSQIIRSTVSAGGKSPRDVGEMAARDLLDQGAAELIAAR